MNKMFYLTSSITADIYLQVIEKDISNSPEIEIIFSKGNKNCSKIVWEENMAKKCHTNKAMLLAIF